ncbi:hypothetical protein DFA_03880 [Cavenderia fasciculata]|uniref:SnoaL-like domain-containing protein n=1 Tax=Cavenderia fasciculata TaxID=261658 RepID=F4Q0N5_CACFS|nr:uncharacterized protein DFA_03880 [Cavenderia fasciculata]EGG18386.1 hypothetical protein DFA_03880 [Cavenderia fasciculata]|eukprot:XP_004366290.1 hypothetical protein DFA_03880 [Cavenderia fasciculata]
MDILMFRGHFKPLLESKIKEDSLKELYDLFEDSAVIEFPYQSKELPNRLNGIEEIKNYYKDWSSIFQFDDFQVTITKVNDDHIYAETKSLGRIIPTNKPYNQHYISILHTNPTTKKIIKYIEIFNPTIIQDSFNQ